MQDAHEFLITLFDSLHEEEKKLGRSSQNTIVQENFQFEVTEARTCDVCDNVSSSTTTL